jgi:NAD(P)-dependent dehydrogenase (short-subunit alcohol dehydrogenase family)
MGRPLTATAAAPTSDMHDKIVLITGANSGVGYATARDLARRGASLLMVCRNPVSGILARDEVAKVATGPAPILLIADLSSQASIRTLATTVRQRYDRIDVLLNNAGTMFSRRELTVDGIEKTFATNHLAPFLLTNLLLDLVRKAPAGRVVNVTSDSYSSALDFDNLQSEKHHHFLGAYFRSKLENILFTYELARRLEDTNATANCLSPGPTRTRFGSELRGLPALFPLVMKRIPFLLSSPEESALTLIHAASSPELDGISGQFFSKRRPRRTKPVTYDVDVGTRLWSISEMLTAKTAGVTAQVS